MFKLVLLLKVKAIIVKVININIHNGNNGDSHQKIKADPLMGLQLWSVTIKIALGIFYSVVTVGNIPQIVNNN